MIYTSQLHSGDYYVQTTTNAPNREVYAVAALPVHMFANLADAKQAARFAAEWAERNRWTITATDRVTGERVALFTWTQCPRDGMTRAMIDAREAGRDLYDYRAIPA
ncbi:MAG: hypothetical protein KGN33_08170 [Paracoccaceae bacterium]|nr:hypothetical protein [Paracoccaceae bacterium]